MKRRPLDLSVITNHLIVGKTPRSSDYALLRTRGVRLVINMRGEYHGLPTQARRSVRTMWIPTFDTKFTPIRPERLVPAVESALLAIEAGDTVYVHCHQGKHRSVLMAAAILIAQGSNAEDAMQLLAGKRSAADPYVPHIYRAIKNFELCWASRIES